MVEINSILGQRQYDRGGVIVCISHRDRKSVKSFIEEKFGENFKDAILLFEYGGRDAKGWIIRTDTRLIFYINQEANDFVEMDYIKWQIDELSDLNQELTVTSDNSILLAPGKEIVFDPNLISLARLKKDLMTLMPALENPKETMETPEESGVMETLYHLSSKFHNIAKQLERRYNSRQTLKIADEYDVQDLYHSLLKMFFDDIRPEENTPSFGGKSSRIDFLLKKEEIMVEIKMTRKDLTDKKIMEQLILDYNYYKNHHNCKKIFCFVYDPEHLIVNRVGLKDDLESVGTESLPIKIFFSP